MSVKRTPRIRISRDWRLHLPKDGVSDEVPATASDSDSGETGVESANSVDETKDSADDDDGDDDNTSSF